MLIERNLESRFNKSRLLRAAAQIPSQVLAMTKPIAVIASPRGGMREGRSLPSR